MNESSLLDIEDVSVSFRSGRSRGQLTVLDEVSLRIGPAETVGLVGESGSGKSTLANAILGLVPTSGGRIVFDGHEITHATPRQRRALSADMQVVFQDPYSSLNPSRTVGHTLSEPLLVHRDLDRAETHGQVVRMLDRVGLPPDAAQRYPNQFSGGQRQRIAIARALMLSPKLVICDEPVSGLDLSVQAQVLNLLRKLQGEMSLSYLFISHDLDVVRHICHRIVVLYRGHIVEQGPAEKVYQTPSHPYTQALLAAAPIPDPVAQSERRAARKAALTALAHRSQNATSTSGCPFAPRCQHAMEMCTTTPPPLKPRESGVDVACHWYPAPTLANPTQA
jgi:oligopeptide/dipeptide ABC transporter ATP-binding protein